MIPDHCDHCGFHSPTCLCILRLRFRPETKVQPFLRRLRTIT